MSTKERRLGLGLDALLGKPVLAPLGSGAPAIGVPGETVQRLAIDLLAPGPFQPRRRFDESGLVELADSIRQSGIVQPILVRPDPGRPGHYQIIAGERRWRAAQRAKLHEVPVVARPMDDRAAMEVALIENVQRADLTALEEADGYRRLAEEFGDAQEEIARKVGKSRSHVANMIRLLGLPEPVKAMLSDGRLTAGHGRALLAAPDPAKLAKSVVEQGLNVRQTERLAQRAARGPALGKAASVAAKKNANIAALERELSSILGLVVAIHDKGESGTLNIAYRSLEQLDDVIRRLRGATS